MKINRIFFIDDKQRNHSLGELQDQLEDMPTRKDLARSEGEGDWYIKFQSAHPRGAQ